jgi:DnaJ-class molecular chaperone
MSSSAKHTRQQPCTACGGSGMLRQGADSYRTCLVCMGVGTIETHDLDPVLVPARALSASSSASR